MSSNFKHHEPVYREISIQYQPLTAGRNKIDRKENLKEKLKSEIGKDLKKIQDKCRGENLMLDVTFKVIESNEKGRSKTDLDNLLKILLDVLSENMVNGQSPKPGLSIVSNDSHFYEIHCKKIPVTSETEEELSIIISIFS